MPSVLACGTRVSFLHSRYNSSSHIVENNDLYEARVLRGATAEEEQERVLLQNKERECAQVRARARGRDIVKGRAGRRDRVWGDGAVWWWCPWAVVSVAVVLGGGGSYARACCVQG